MNEKMLGRVLIGDDTLEVGIQFANMLKTDGYGVCNVQSDGLSIYDSLYDEPADIAVINAIMPNLDALALLDRWAQVESSVFFIVLSDTANEFLIHEVMGYKNAYFLLKPVDPGSFVSLVNKIMKYKKGANTSTEENFEEEVLTIEE